MSSILRYKRTIYRYTNWLNPLRELIWIGFQVFTGAKTPMNGAVSLMLKEAVTGNNRENYAIDFAKVILSRGELMISLIKQILVLSDQVLRIEWQSPSASVFCKPDDKVNIVVYNELKQQFVIFKNVAKRVDEQVDLQLPDNFAGDTLHLWMHYVNAKGDAVSTSIYVRQDVV